LRELLEKRKMAYTSYEFFYDGMYEPIDKSYGEFFTGYRLPAGKLGASTSIQTANQVQEVATRLNEGMKVVEMSVLDPRIMEMIPRQHMQEINRLSKLTGTEATLHGPLIDPAGFSREGWSEANRSRAERELLNTVDRAHALNPDGNVPVSFHSSHWGFPGAEYEKVKKDGVWGEQKVSIVAVNPETGQPSVFKREKVYYPDRQEEYSPEKRLEVYNNTTWINQTTGLLQMAKHGDEIISNPDVVAAAANPDYEKYTLEQKYKGQTPGNIANADNEAQKAIIFYSDAEAGIRSIYDNAYKYGVLEEKDKRLADYRKKQLDKYAVAYKEIMPEIHRKEQKEGDFVGAALRYKKLCEIGTGVLKSMPPVEMMRPVEEFALDKSARTVGNVAYQAYKKFGEHAPIVSLENPPGEIGGFSRANQLKNLVHESRNQFVKTAVENGMSESKAEQQAEKLIGATWDVGHINLLRKGGFTEADIIEETKRIAPVVKHVHLADNFGYQEAHLPPGMGGVPIKPMLEELEKAGFRGRAIVEAGEFVQHFKTSPHPYALAAMGSPMYDMKAAPYWNQAMGIPGTYTSYGINFPEQHFSLYGGGFSGLPAELGGKIPGKQSRMSGTPMD
jgi:sugar phosphate isomerase/epimerase